MKKFIPLFFVIAALNPFSASAFLCSMEQYLDVERVEYEYLSQWRSVKIPEWRVTAVRRFSLTEIESRWSLGGFESIQLPSPFLTEDEQKETEVVKAAILTARDMEVTDDLVTFTYWVRLDGNLFTIFSSVEVTTPPSKGSEVIVINKKTEGVLENSRLEHNHEYGRLHYKFKCDFTSAPPQFNQLLKSKFEIHSGLIQVK